MKQPPIRETNFSGLKLASRGKVRDIYDLGEHLLLVATDRISAFDVVMDEAVPKKGVYLTQMSLFWFNMFSGKVRNHLVSANPADYPDICPAYRSALIPYLKQLEGRSMLVQKCRPLDIESIVRGYISGSGWKDYLRDGAICGIKLPPGLLESERLPETIFAPSTKGKLGEHDQNITFEQAAEIVGIDVANFVKKTSLMLYEIGHDYCLEKGIILADTKHEYGMADDGEIILIDEVHTPDSSRFWNATTFEPGHSQVSYDKQPVRDFLDQLEPRWNKKPPPPPLPEWVVTNTQTRYREALYRLTGQIIS